MDKDKNKNIYFFTGSYPYGYAETFIESEIVFTSKVFKKIIVIPTVKFGNKRSYPDNVIIDDSLTQMFDKKNRKLKNLFTIATLKALLIHWRYLYSITAIKRINSFISDGKIVYKWLRKNNIDNSIIYTYWLNGKTQGAIDYKLNLNKNIMVVSRAHGYDLYNYRHVPAFWPYRQKTLITIDRLYVISLDAKKFLEKKYKTIQNIRIARLGIQNKSIIGKVSEDKILRILSISNFHKVKRIPLLFENLLNYAENNPKVHLNWIHFGAGQGMEELITNIKKNNIDNLKVNLKGRVVNEDIYKYLAKEPIDLFINTSESEGVPVSIMEAQSFGKFVIATDVGGTKELISNETGYLLEKNFCYEDFKSAIDYYISNHDEIKSMATKIRDNCLQNYDAKKNFDIFASDMSSLLNE